jgi:two-component system, NtrC family, nitrogen regulation sensor histidine kinase NtrY
MSDAREPRHRRDNRFIVAVGLAVFFIWGAVYLSQESGHPLAPGTLASRVPLFVLWYLDVTLIAATLFVIFRALFKLLLERRRGVLGAQFKTKILITHLGLTAIPIGLLFFAATDLLQRSIDRWFSTPVATMVRRAETLRDLADRRSQDAAARDASALAQIVNENPGMARETLGRDLRLRSYAMVELYPPDGPPLRLGADLADAPAPYPAERVREALAAGISRTEDVRPDGAHWFRAAARSLSGVIVVALRVPAAEAAPFDQVARAWSDYRKMEVQKSAIKATNLLVFSLLTLALLFAAIWTGLTLAKRITAPIEALAQSTRRIAQGELGVRVDVPASDELGVLVDSFNAMASEIQENRSRLESSNQELVAINRRLDRERELLSTILATARTGILALDREGRTKIANPAALEILGLSQAPENIEALRGRTDLAPLFQSLESARQGGQPAPREISPAGVDGTRRAEISVAAMPGEDGPRGFVVAIEDTTEVARAQRLAAWSEAARRVAHEIKNPLTPIKLSAERMIRKMNARDPGAEDAVRRGAEVIIEEVNLLKSLVDQFARFARIPEPKPEATDLPALAQRTLAFYEDARPGVALRLENALPKKIYRLDPEQLQRVLVNLIDNALEACRQGGCVTLGLSERAGRLTVEVSDTGGGIAARDREKIFLPDFSTKPEGAGLGLAIVSRIVADHKGTIRCEENRPSGTRFVIELPAA